MIKILKPYKKSMRLSKDNIMRIYFNNNLEQIIKILV
jgi:hypothetical protein